MLDKKLYGHAMVCFDKSGDEEYKIKSEACLLATQASMMSGEMRKEKFMAAAKKFEATGEKKQAAQCYYSAKEYYQASRLFREYGMVEEGEKCSKLISNWQQVAQQHVKEKRWKEALECYNRARAYEEGLAMISAHREEFKNVEWKSFMQRYCEHYRKEGNDEMIRKALKESVDLFEPTEMADLLFR